MSKIMDLLAAYPGPLVAPGCYDALSAVLIYEAGFPAAFLSGGSVAYTRLGRPDVGLVTATETEEVVSLICDRVDLPIIVDADTGYGNALNLQRTMKRLEKAGAAACVFEDQVTPKRCGHLAGKALISTAEMVGKIKAGLDARSEAAVFARCDAIAVEGFEAAIDRAHEYIDAGAEVLFVEAPPSVEHMKRLCDELGARVPMLVNCVEGGTTPMLSAPELGAIGYRIVIFPGALVRAYVATARTMLQTLVTDGTTNGFRDRMVDLRGVNDAVGSPAFIAAGKRYDAAMQDWDVTPGQGAGA
jgi:2-methylisocitrate lyase-like PEP mutase family enzyme